MNTRRMWLTLAALVVAGALLAACGGGAPAALDVTIKGQDIKFFPPVLAAKAGQAVNVSYVNEGALDHSFVIDELGVNQAAIPAGQTATFSFTPSAAGTYTYYCNVPGHKVAGMVGTLTVTQ